MSALIGGYVKKKLSRVLQRLDSNCTGNNECETAKGFFPLPRRYIRHTYLRTGESLFDVSSLGSVSISLPTFFQTKSSDRPNRHYIFTHQRQFSLHGICLQWDTVGGSLTYYFGAISCTFLLESVITFTMIFPMTFLESTRSDPIWL